MNIRITAKTEDGFEKQIEYIYDIKPNESKEIEIDLKTIKSADILVIKIEGNY
jgi:hypothetical protein